MLTLLEAMACQVAIGCKFPSADVARVLRYFREYFEPVHHARECADIYPIVLMHGDESESELAGALIREHDDTKMLLHSLVLFWEPEDYLRPEERDAFADLVRTYSRRMRRHMQHEEEALFPAAVRVQTTEEAGQTEIDTERLDPGRARWKHWLTEAKELEAAHLK